MNRFKNPNFNKGKLIPTPNTAIINRFPYKHPVFCLKYLHKDFNVELCSDDDKVFLISRMARLSQLTWDQIKQAPRHAMGSEKIERSSIKASIPKEITDDVQFFLSLRYWGKRAFIGFRTEFIFHIVYIDRNFEVYKH